MTAGAEPDAQTDGRLLRSERSRQRIVDALYELVGEGELTPSAQMVADRAEVGIRTVFRLFSDMDALYATIDARITHDAGPWLGKAPPEGVPLGERVEAMIATRVALYEQFGAYLRATRRHRDRSAFLAAGFRKLVGALRAGLLRWIPELRDAPGALVEAFDQATSFEAWDRLRNEQRLSRPRAQAAVQFAASALVARLEEST